MEKHLQQSVLARLPYGYQSILKQSISSEEDDMGIIFFPFYILSSNSSILLELVVSSIFQIFLIVQHAFSGAYHEFLSL